MKLGKLLALLLIPVFWLSSVCSVAADGAAVFQEMKCGMCHKPDKKSAAVSVEEIARAYPERAGLVKMFNGEANPLIETEKWGMMRGPLSKIQALGKEDKEALADYIMRFKQ